jgi:thiamine-phosphate pyrophosphorylase
VRGLYPIVDVTTLLARGLSVVEFAERVLCARPPLLQLRAKELGPFDTLELLRALRPLCTRAGTLLFANDRADLAQMAGCDGVHVGQDDLALGQVRAVAPGLAVGVSTHDLAQLERALAERPAYVAFGPVFSTRSKARAEACVGLAGLEQAGRLAAAAQVPLCAIGGLALEHMAQIAEYCALGAVIAALLPNDRDLESVTSAALALQHALAGDPPALETQA